MADITTKNKIGVKSGSLHARIAEKELLKEVAPQAVDVNSLPNRIAIMIDCSGSMSGDSIKHLENALQDFIQKSNSSDTAIAVESFPEQVRIELTDEKQKLWLLCMGLKADGGTPMSAAMAYCLRTYPKMTRAILISDGQPNDSPMFVVQGYKSSKIPIDTVHIGEAIGGEEVLKEISEATGGLFVKFKDVKSFAGAFAFLLPETREQAASLFLTSGANEVR